MSTEQNLLLKYLFIPDKGMSTSQFGFDINYYIAVGLLDEAVTVFIAEQTEYKDEKKLSLSISKHSTTDSIC